MVPVISRRVADLQTEGGDGWELFNRARQMRAEGQAVIDLTVGEPDTGTPPEILTAMHNAARRGATGYAPILGLPALRDAIAARTQARTGVPTTRDNVLVTPGGQAALWAALAACCDPGDRVLMLQPHFSSYPHTIRSLGAVPVAVACRPDHDFQPQAGDVAAAAPGARALVVNTPNNPTGAVYGPGTLQGLAQVAQAHGLWTISDEVYETQVWQGSHISPRALPGMADRTLVVNSLSKSHAMTGSRLGWVIGPAPVIAHLSDLSNATTFGVATFVQAAAAWALEHDAGLEARVAAPVGRRNAMVRDMLARRPGIAHVPAQGGMYVMIDIRHTGLTGTDFARRLLEREKIAVMPGEVFGDAAAGHVRVALTVDEDRLADALDRLCGYALLWAA